MAVGQTMTTTRWLEKLSIPLCAESNAPDEPAPGDPWRLPPMGDIRAEDDDSDEEESSDKDEDEEDDLDEPVSIEEVPVVVEFDENDFDDDFDDDFEEDFEEEIEEELNEEIRETERDDEDFA